MAGGDPLAQDEPRTFLSTEGGEITEEEDCALCAVEIGALGAVVGVAVLLVLRVARTRPMDGVDVR